MMSAIALLCCLVAENANDPAAEDGGRWRVVTIAGNPIGYEFERTLADEDGTTVESTSRVSMKRFGQDFEMRIIARIEEGEGGRLRGFRMETTQSGQSQVNTGTVANGTLTVSVPKGAGTETRTQPLAEDVLAPTFVDRWVREATPGPGESKSFKVFSIETLAPITVTVSGLGPKTTADREGEQVTLRAVQMTRDDMPLKSTYYLDGDGHVVKVDTGLMGMQSFAASREEALAAAGGSSFDFGERSLLRIQPVPSLSASRSARYKVSGGELPDLPGVQRSVRRGDWTLVTVTTPSLGGLDVTGEAGEEYLASTRWVDWKSPEVTAIAGKLDRDKPAGDRAIAAEKLVRGTISATSYGVGFASASETAKAGTGDCTEHGVLLCGVLRAVGIPARVAYGFVYVDSASAMVPHMWTEAYLGGGWKPLDATRPGWPEAGYLKFGDSALDSDASLPTKDLLELSQSVDRMKVSVLETSRTNLYEEESQADGE